MSEHGWMLVDAGDRAEIPWEWCWKCGCLRVAVDNVLHDWEYFPAGVQPDAVHGRLITGSINEPECGK